MGLPVLVLRYSVAPSGRVQRVNGVVGMCQGEFGIMLCLVSDQAGLQVENLFAKFQNKIGNELCYGKNKSPTTHHYYN